MKFVLALCLLTVVSISAQQTPVVLCGRQLANARVMLCYGKTYIDKREYTDNMNDIFLDKDEMEETWPWSGRRGALAANWARYKRQGLADECCKKPCTAEVILNYC